MSTFPSGFAHVSSAASAAAPSHAFIVKHPPSELRFQTIPFSKPENQLAFVNAVQDYWMFSMILVIDQGRVPSVQLENRWEEKVDKSR